MLQWDFVIRLFEWHWVPFRDMRSWGTDYGWFCFRLWIY